MTTSYFFLKFRMCTFSSITSAQFTHKGNNVSKRPGVGGNYPCTKTPHFPPFLFTFLLRSEATTESIYYSPRTERHQRRNGAEIEGRRNMKGLKVTEPLKNNNFLSECTVMSLRAAESSAGASDELAGTKKAVKAMTVLHNAGHVARTGEKRGAYRILVGRPE
jgi:hypothetical protein